MSHNTPGRPLIDSEVNRKHPCFNGCAKHRYGRVHLPVAPGCNIRCNYCSRRYDCVNESRPGVTSSIIQPHEAVEYLAAALKREPRITVVGIAGPGDPFHDPERTLETLRSVHEAFPDLLLCLSSNGLNVHEYIDSIVRAGVRFATITVNAVDPVIGAQIYSWVTNEKKYYVGRKAAQFLLSRQLKAIYSLKQAGVTVKVNSVIIPGINDRHMSAIAEKMQTLNVDLMNCIPMIPVSGTPFSRLPSLGGGEINRIRDNADRFLPQMRHCVRCRADAIGLLDDDSRDMVPGVQSFSP